MKAGRKLAVWLFGMLVAGTATAQTQTWSITVKPGNAVESTLATDRVNIMTGTTATINVQCDTGVDCSQIGLQLESGGAVLTTLTPSGSGSSRTFTLGSGSVVSTGTDLVLTSGGTQIATFRIGTVPGSGGTTLQGQTTQGSTSSGASGGTTVLSDLLRTSCPGTFTAGYDAEANRGEIVVTPVGNVLARALDTFDENDTLIVKVVGDVELLPLLKVERTSAFRDVGTVRIVGGDQQLPQIARQAGGCGVQQFTLNDFAPGRATVRISALQGTQEVPLGTFDFNVNPLYSGMFTLGAAWTNLVDPGFKLVSEGGQTVIGVNEEGDRDLLYVLSYTPFVWGKRDLEKRIPWHQRLNPMIGIAVNDVQDNAFVGISADLPAGVILTFGRHFRRITVLPEGTGLAVGDPFTGTADQLPTAKEWENENFFGLTIDLRAMVQLLRVAAGTAGGGS